MHQTGHELIFREMAVAMSRCSFLNRKNKLVCGDGVQETPRKNSCTGSSLMSDQIFMFIDIQHIEVSSVAYTN